MKKTAAVVVLSCLAGIGLLAAGMALAIAHVSRDIPPPDVSDLAVERPVLAPEKNGCTYFFSATAALYRPENKMLVTGYLEGDPVDEAVIRDVIARNAEAVRLVDEGVACGVCLAPEVTTYDSPLSSLGSWRDLARLLAAKSRHERLAGDYAAATQTCVLLLRFGNLLQRDAGSTIHYLVGVSVLDLGLTQARDLALDTGTPPDELKRLSETLAALGPFDQGMVRVLKVEYVCAANTVDRIAQGKLALKDLSNSLGGDGSPSYMRGRRPPRYFFQPNKTKLLFADCYRTLIKTASLTYADQPQHEVDLETATEAKNGIVKLLMRPNVLGTLMFRMVGPALSGLPRKKCAMECGVGGTRLVVALAAYRKQEGKYPADLQALVPAYLPAVPADPFDGKPFRYAAAKGIVYSVGIDLQDSGGSMRSASLPKEGKPSASRVLWKAEDIVFAFAPASPAGTP